MGEYTEKRSTPRISVNVNCTILVVDENKAEHITSGVVKDISNDGICVMITDQRGTSDIVKNAKEIRITFVGPVHETLGKGTVTVKLYERWISERDDCLFLGGIYENIE